MLSLRLRNFLADIGMQIPLFIVAATATTIVVVGIHASFRIWASTSKDDCAGACVRN
jgi:hypothetical protein